MNKKDIEELINIAKENGLSELSFKDQKGEEVKFKFPFGTSESQVISRSPAIIADQVAPARAEQHIDDGLKVITSPFVGTFYRSSSPEAKSYVEKGQKVSSGDVLCIVEAMKIMNEIETDFSGTVEEVCVENEMYVEFGQPLFKIKP